MQAKIPVIAVTHSLERGGTEQHLLQVFRRLDRARFDASVLPLHMRGGLVDAFRDADLLQHPIRGGRFGALRNLAAASWRQRPLVHCFLPEAYLLGAPVALTFGATAVIMSRRNRNHYHRRYPIAAWAERQLHGRMAALVGNSQAVMADLVAEGAAREKLCRISNGVDVSRFATGRLRDEVRQRFRSRLGISADRIVLTCVANFFSYKGHADLLRAMAALGPRFSQRGTLLLAGRDAGSLEEVKSLTSLLRLSGNVRFLGNVDHVPDLLAASDIGVLASHEEGFSNAVLEGMAAGLPMVVTDVGGNREAVANEQCGMVVPAQEPERLAEALGCLLENPLLRAQLGAAGCTRVRSEYSIEACVVSYESLYQQIWTDGTLAG